MHAARANNVPGVRALLKAGAHHGMRPGTPINRTPLMVAAQSNALGAMRALLKAGVDKDEVDDEGWTALIFAAAAGHAKVAKALLKAGANANIAEEDDWTALAHAAYRGKADVVAALLATRDIEIDYEDDIGRTPLMQAIAQQHGAVVKMLLKAKAMVEHHTVNGSFTPLVLAAQRGVLDTVQAILEAGAKVDMPSVAQGDCAMAGADKGSARSCARCSRRRRPASHQLGGQDGAHAHLLRAGRGEDAHAPRRAPRGRRRALPGHAVRDLLGKNSACRARAAVRAALARGLRPAHLRARLGAHGLPAGRVGGRFRLVRPRVYALDAQCNEKAQDQWGLGGVALPARHVSSARRVGARAFAVRAALRRLAAEAGHVAPHGLGPLGARPCELVVGEEVRAPLHLRRSRARAQRQPMPVGGRRGRPRGPCAALQALWRRGRR